MVVSLSDAGAEPHAVVVKLEDAVVADMTVRSSWRPENFASLAVLELVEHVSLAADHVVEDPGVFVDVLVSPSSVFFATMPCPRRYDTRISSCSHHEVPVDYRNE